MQNSPSQNSYSENKPCLDDVLEELLEEARLLDDHGSVTMGRREDKPKFHDDAEENATKKKKTNFSH